MAAKLAADRRLGSPAELRRHRPAWLVAPYRPRPSLRHGSKNSRRDRRPLSIDWMKFNTEIQRGTRVLGTAGGMAVVVRVHFARSSSNDFVVLDRYQRAGLNKPHGSRFSFRNDSRNLKRKRISVRWNHQQSVRSWIDVEFDLPLPLKLLASFL